MSTRLVRFPLGVIQKKPFGTITVQQVLDRAGIGRSTFYAHYRDKDDLFLSDLEDFFELMSTLLLRHRETTNRVAPVCELFAHLAQMRHLHAVLIAADTLRDFVVMGQEYFARAIHRRLGELSSSRTIAPMRRTAMAPAFAGALLSLMSWWIDHGASASPEEMDDLYHEMVWSAVNARSASSGPIPVT
jgi:AcrR family transcriptional regulator